MDVLGANRLQRVVCSKRSCGFSTQAQWNMLPQSYPNYKTVHRRFQTWCRDEILRRVLMDVANELRDRGALNEEECFIDATFVMAKGGGLEIGSTKRGKGMKIMAIVDRHGLPLSVSTHAANHHELRLVQLCFDFYMIEAKPENLIGDRAYDSDPLRLLGFRLLAVRQFVEDVGGFVHPAAEALAWVSRRFSACHALRLKLKMSLMRVITSTQDPT